MPDLKPAELEQLFALYDQAAGQLLEVAVQDGHFAGWDCDQVVWPASRRPADAASLERRARLVGVISDGIPARRDSRLAEAYAKYLQALPVYHEAACVYLQVQRQFVVRQAGQERDFLQLYQALYLDALGREEPLHLDAGEAALVHLRVARSPLAHGQSVAEKLQREPALDDPRWDDLYRCGAPGQERTESLRGLLHRIAESSVDLLAAGEHLAIRYNTFSNFIWFGISIWKAVSEVELLLARLAGKVRRAWLEQLQSGVYLAQGMLLKFLQAHQEDPAQIRPKEYWYGQQYSYLTRDMIDLALLLVEQGNRLRRRVAGAEQTGVPAVQVPPLLHNRVSGRFMEYPEVGRHGRFGGWERRLRLLRWARLTRASARRKRQLWHSGLPEQERLRLAWQCNLEWGRRTLELFDIQVQVRIDPAFARVAAALELARGGRKIVFFPTHQSLLDHPVMYQVLQSPELLDAMGWPEPAICTQLARARLMETATLAIAGLRLSLIGVDAETADRMFEEVDGYVVLEHSKDTGNPTQRFARLLEQRPGVVYGAGTTSAFELQCLPIQHALFAQLPSDVVFIPMAFRGIHALWPKCPKGNLNLGPGRVEVVVSPPMLGETTLLPRKRALRTQLEPATLFQAVHIANLYNPEHSSPTEEPP